jgi:queuine tRNA-ribosyltransferase
MAALAFTLEKKDLLSKARAGKIKTDHGVIETPIFMPVGTVGSVKAVSQQQLINDVGAQIILGNTYHLGHRPVGKLFKFSGKQNRIGITFLRLNSIFVGAVWSGKLVKS